MDAEASRQARKKIIEKKATKKTYKCGRSTRRPENNTTGLREENIHSGPLLAKPFALLLLELL